MADSNEHDPASVLTAQLLGRVSLQIGDRVIADDAWPPRGGRDLLLLLLTTPGHRLPRERVYEALWPDLGADAASNAFYKALHSLRRTLEPRLASRDPGSFVVSEAGAVWLVPGAVATDLNAFDAALSRADLAPPREKFAALTTALAVYQGELLAGERDRDWIGERRHTVRRAWQRAVTRLTEHLLDGGDVRGVIVPLEAIVAADPLNEEALRLLIRAYSRLGQRDQAQRHYARGIAALRDELDIDPSPETLRLGADLLRPELPTRTDQPVRVNPWPHLPTPPTDLIGREQELEQLGDLLSLPAIRMITLIGPGGIGKTRLALEVAAEAARTVRQDVVYVSFAAVPDAALVPQAMLRSLGGSEAPHISPLDQLCRVLRNRGPLLLLDNLEHLLAAAPTLATVLADCPDVKMLVTSREPLHLRAEWLFEVAPLAVPNLGEGGTLPSLPVLARTASVALFVARAAAIVPGFRLNHENAAAVARICARLEGLPLAIELAAARSRTLPPDRLLNVLTNRLDTLVDGYADFPPRQRTIRDAIAWSHDLLPAELQVLFRRLAVFSGGCTAGMAAKLVGASGEDAAVRLQALVDKSLLRWRTSGDEARVEMLEITREFALEQLRATGEAETAFDFLVAAAMALTAEAATHLSGPDQAMWLDRLDDERDNLRAALAWTIERGDADRALALCGNLWRYWWCRTAPTEGREWIGRALALSGAVDPRLRGTALNGAASLAESQGDFVHAVALHSEALEIWRTLRDLAGEARALTGLGTAATHRGEYGAAHGYLEHALSLVQQAGDVPGTARTLERLGTVARHQGDTDRAEERYAQSLELFRGAGDRVNAAIVLSNLGEVRHSQGRLEDAAALFEEALRLERELDTPDGVAFELTNLARVRLELGELERAAALSAQGIRLFRDMDNQLGLAGALSVYAMILRTQGEPERAVHYHREGLRLLTELDERSAMPEQLEMLAAALGDDGQARLAVQTLGAAAALREVIASPPAAADQRLIEETLAAARAAIGAEAVRSAFAIGAALPLDQALSRALGDGAGEDGLRPSV